MEGIPTRMGDGSLVRMTRAEIEADIHAGVEAGAKRAKVEPLGDDEIAHLADIFAQPRTVQCGRHRRRGHPHVRRRRQPGRRLAHHRPAELRADGLHRHGRALSPRLLVQADQAGPAVRAGDHAPDAVAAHHPGAPTAPCRTSGATPCPTARSPTGRSCCRWAASTRPVRPRRRLWRPRSRTSSTLPRACTRPAPTASTSTPRGRPATPTSWPPSRPSSASARSTRTGVSRSAWRASSSSACTGELEYDGVRLAGLWPADQMRLAAKAGVSIFGPAVNVNTGKTVAWNVARTCTIVKPCMDAATDPGPPQRGDGRGRRPDARAAAGRRRLARLARVRRHPAARRLVDRRRRQPQPGVGMVSRRAWADCGPPEIWWPACRSPDGCGFPRRRPM